MVTFSSRGKHFTATSNDIFMDNGAVIVYIKNGKFASPLNKNVELGKKEWERIKPQLTQLEYEAYYGRKPLLNGVSIFKVKEN